MTEPNYLPELAKLIAAGVIPVVPGRVVPVAVVHDDGCDVFDGKACNCDPEIQPGSPQQPACCP